jgi:hypothetical protein
MRKLLLLIVLIVTSEIYSQNICFTSGDDNTFPTNIRPIYLDVADLNNDTYLDLVTSHFFSNSFSQGYITVRFGNGDGTLQSGLTYTAGTSTSRLSIIDFNGDGKKDIVVISGSNIISVLLNTGSGAFSAATDYTVGNNVNDVAVGDFTGDNIADIATANFSDNNISLLKGLGNGLFIPHNIINVGNEPISLIIQDFNSDTQNDIAVANQNSSGMSSVSILLSAGSGSFLPISNYTVGAGSRDIKSGDYNNDLKTDLVFANNGNNNVTILQGGSAGSFGGIVTLPTGSYARETVLGDFNNDGKMDIVSGNQGPAYNDIFIGSGTSVFPQHYKFDCPPLYSVKGGDFNGDGNKDFCGIGFTSDAIFMFIGDGTGKFKAKTHIAANSFNSSEGFFGDFDNDKIIDIGFFDPLSGNTEILKGLSDKTYTLLSTSNIGTDVSYVKVSDLDKDSFLDLVVMHGVVADFTLTIMKGTGSGNFISTGTFTGIGQPKYCNIADFDNDGALDILASKEYNSGGGFYRYKGLGACMFSALTYTPVSHDLISVGNINSDTIPDLIIYDGATYISMIGIGGFNYNSINSFTVSWAGPIEFGDFNNDGNNDVLLNKWFAMDIYLGDGAGNFSYNNTINTNNTFYVNCVGDFNNDNITDIAYQGSCWLGVFEGLGNSNFKSEVDFISDAAYEMIPKDFNNDSLLDIGFFYGSNRVEVFYNYSAILSSVNSKTLCVGEVITVKTNTLGYSYNWSPNSSITNSATLNSAGTFSVEVSNLSGSCISTSKAITIAIDPCVGIKEFGKELENLEIFPNPTNENFKIKLNSINELVLLYIYNSEGKLLFQATTSEKITDIDFSNESPGIYLLQLRNNTQSYSTKIIKQ